MFDEQGKRIPRFDKDGSKISTLIVYKIEPNPGAGLWRPHNDQLPNERKGESVYRIFAGLGERGFDYKKELQKVARASGISTDAPETPGAAGRYVGSGLYEAPAPKAPSAGQAAEAVDRATLVDQAIDRAREELGQ